LKSPIYSIQALRGLAAFLVVLLHACYKETVYSNGFFTGFHFGNIGVDIFFIVSGFIMLHTINANTQPFDFLVKRFIRIYPIYWVTSIVALAGYIFVPNLVNSGREADLLATFLLLPTQVGYLNPNAWTLGFELFFYLILFVVLLLSFRFRVLLTTLIIGALGLFGLYDAPSGNWSSFVFDTILFEFAFGFLVYGLYLYFVKLNRYLVPIRLLSVVLFVLFLDIDSSLRFINSGIPAFCICIFILTFEPLLQKKPIGLLMKLGDSSYSLYLIHAFVLSGGGFILSKVSFVANNSYLFVSLLIITSLVAGYWCFKFVEQPLTRYILKYYRRIYLIFFQNNLNINKV
jgi:peptidoglycan/LPS O-acetylase OafA/YrhL